MLVRICVENFKSFAEPIELTTIPSKRIRPRGFSEHCVSVKKNRFLKYAAIYGANAAGKTNLVDFFKFFQQTAKFGLPQDSCRFFCRNCPELAEKESRFEIQFSTNGEFYAYGFSALLKTRKITGEYLVKLYPSGETSVIYQLRTDPKQRIEHQLKLDENDAPRFKTYIDDFSNVSDSLFLTELNRNKVFAPDSPLSVFNTAYRWLVNNIRIISPNDSLMDLRFYFDSGNTGLVNEFLPVFDAGATNIKLEQAALSDLKKAIPAPALDGFVKNVRNAVNVAKNEKTFCSVKAGAALFNFEIWNDREEPQNITTLSLTHGDATGFYFEDESDGTRRLFDLFSVLLTKEDDVTFVIDELDRSLHPMLTRQFINLFHERFRKKTIQLLFTTHEASLMTSSLFRRDEIWFVERDSHNCSSVYSLDQFKESGSGTRSIEEEYLDGRYGAVPVLKSYKFHTEL